MRNRAGYKARLARSPPAACDPPTALHPGVADVAGIGSASHAGNDGLLAAVGALEKFDRTAVAAAEKLPLLEREVRQLVDADEQELGALVAVDVVFVAAVAEPRGRAVFPGDDVLGVVELLIFRPGDVAAKLCEERRLQFRVGAAKQQRIAARHLVGFADRLPKQCLGFARAGGTTEEPIFCSRLAKLLLSIKGF